MGADRRRAQGVAETGRVNGDAAKAQSREVEGKEGRVTDRAGRAGRTHRVSMRRH